MKKNLILILSAFLATIAISCSNHATEATTEEAKASESNMMTEEAASKDEAMSSEEKIVYTCPMHPEVVSDTEGTCPKCGMKLEIKK